MSKPRVSVLLDDPEVLATDLSKIARVVAASLGQPEADAALKVRYGHGIVARDIPMPYAKQISRGLAQLGHGSFTVAALSPPPRSKRVGVVQVGKQGVKLGVRFKQPIDYAWEDVLAVNAFAVRTESGSSESDTLPLRATSATTAAVNKLREGIELYEDRERVRVRLGIDVLVTGPLLYRIRHETTGVYAQLEGRSRNALENFIRLLSGLLANAPAGVVIPPGTRRLLSRHEYTDVLFLKPEELESFNTWLLHAREEGVDYGGVVEDLADEVLHDEDEALVVEGEDEDAEDLDDEELEDLEDSRGDAEDAEDAEDARDTGVGSSTQELAALTRDAEALSDEDLAEDGLEEEDVSEVLDHFDKTTRLQAADVLAMINAAEGLDDEVATADLKSSEVQDALGFFDGSSGAWDVSKLVSEDGLLREPTEDEAAS